MSGFKAKGNSYKHYVDPCKICGEAEILALAGAYQNATEWNQKYSDLAWQFSLFEGAQDYGRTPEVSGTWHLIST